MVRNFSWKLALNNIKNNRKFYLPYFLAAAGIISMFYIICFLAMSEGISVMSDSLSVIMGLGVGVMGIFAFIFLFYTNSFLMKQRKKEIGLYNILGMEKRHIGRVLMIENVLISGASMVVGLLCGILFSKLIYLFLSWVFGAAPPFGIEISKEAMFYSLVLFGVLFVLTTFTNQMSIRLAKPIELLHGGNVGEKEPKAKGLLALAGFLCLGSGYFIAITTESPLDALLWFFIAVVLVVLGTYCLFTSGSIVVLKALRKNKKFYYKPGNFTAVSGLIYRMKQNAVGLANICILSTMVLVMVSGTVSLYFGSADMLQKMAPGDVNVTMYREEAGKQSEKVKAAAQSRAEKMGVKLDRIACAELFPFVAVEKDGAFVFEKASNENLNETTAFAVMTASSYESLTGAHLELSGNQVALNAQGKALADDFSLGELQLQVVQKVEDLTTAAQFTSGMTDVYYVVVADDEVLMQIYKAQQKVFAQNNGYVFFYAYIDMDCAVAVQQQYAQALQEDLSKAGLSYEMMQVETREDVAGPLRGLTGGFLFLGVFLGIVFTFAAALIIYYKQISEGYYDKDKFEIMQKVGMSKAEVRRTIRRQVLMVFFVPLVMAGLHIAAAFKMITKLLLVFGMTNVGLFALCTVATFLVFAVIYALVYMVTAREYYKIVG